PRPAPGSCRRENMPCSTCNFAHPSVAARVLSQLQKTEFDSLDGQGRHRTPKFDYQVKSSSAKELLSTLFDLSPFRRLHPTGGARDPAPQLRRSVFDPARRQMYEIARPVSGRAVGPRESDGPSLGPTNGVSSQPKPVLFDPAGRPVTRPIQLL